MFNIFISYSTKDLDKVKPIFEPLKKIDGANVFFAEDSIKPGDKISKTIIDNIKLCDIFLLFHSESAKNSDYVRQEIWLANGESKIIVPILLDSTKPVGVLADINHVDLSGPTKAEDEIARLYSLINDKIQRKNQAAFGLLIGCLFLLAVVILGSN